MTEEETDKFILEHKGCDALDNNHLSVLKCRDCYYVNHFNHFYCTIDFSSCGTVYSYVLRKTNLKEIIE